MAYLLATIIVGFLTCAIWAFYENKRTTPIDGKPIISYDSIPVEEAPVEEAPVEEAPVEEAPAVNKPRVKKETTVTPKGPRKPKMTVVK